MELFAITCTTCKSRLKVRDPAAIGQILACPKCGGMVMVKPPPAFSEATEQKSDLPTATEVEGPALKFDQTPNNSAFEILDELLSDAPPRVKAPPPPTATPLPSPTPPTAPKPRFVGGPPHRSSTPPGGKSAATPPPVAAAVKQNTAAAPAPPPASSNRPTTGKSNAQEPTPPPPAEQAAPASKNGKAVVLGRPRGNYWLLMAGSIVLGIGLALIAVCAVILLRPTGQKSAHASTTAKNANNSAKKQPSTSNTTSPVPIPSESSQPGVPATQPASSVQPPPGATSTPATASATNDPPDLTIPPPPSPASASPSSDPLAKFDRIIGGADGDPLAKPPTPSTEVALPAAAVDITPPRPLAQRPPPREIDVTKRLADSLLGIETTGTPLAEFVELMSELSTIPITLEVPFPPATPESPVVLKAANTTIEKTLKEALAALRLEYVVSDDQLILRRPEPQPFASLTHEVKDLTGGDPQQLTEFVELLQAVVEPGLWGEGAGQGTITADPAKGTIVITHRRTVQFQVLVAVEKLRASYLPPLAFKTKFDPALFGIDSRLKQASSRLSKTVTLNFSQPKRLVEILNRLGETAGIRILVDWHDVASAGWNPAGEASFVASNQPLVAALENLLTPLDLTVRVIDARTFQVVTPARLAGQGELEFYKVADLIRGETTDEVLIARIRASLGDDAFLSGGGPGELRYHDATKTLLAWLPQPKQWELESLLTKWRTDATK